MGPEIGKLTIGCAWPRMRDIFFGPSFLLKRELLRNLSLKFSLFHFENDTLVLNKSCFRLNTNRGSRRSSRNASRRRTAKRDQSSPSPRASGAASTTPSTIEQCLTETTDCPSSDVSVITSISRKTVQQQQFNPDVIQHAHVHPPPQVEQHTIVRAQLHQIPPHLQHMTRPLQVISPVQLRMLVREKLMTEGIRLSAPPYTSPKVGLN